MATKTTNPQNKHHAAFPSLFKRTGEARRIKGFRASREMFTRAIRMGKVLDMSPRLMIITPVGAMVLSEAATALIKEDGGIEALLLNGFDIFPARDVMQNETIDSFIKEHKLDLTQSSFIEDDANEGE